MIVASGTVDLYVFPSFGDSGEESQVWKLSLGKHCNVYSQCHVPTVSCSTMWQGVNLHL